MLHGKLAYIMGGVVLAIAASATTYRFVTGECPLAALCHAVHGKTTTEVKVANPPTSN